MVGSLSRDLKWGVPEVIEVRNVTKELLRRGEIAYGFQIRVLKDLEVARAIVSTGFHFAFLDLEHGTLTDSDACKLALLLATGGVTPIARIAEGDFASALRLIEGGVQGIIVPHVNTVEQAREAVANCKYGPIGTLWKDDGSIHFGWTSPPHLPLNLALNDLLLLVVMIESEEGLANVESIAATEGVDVLSVGTSDLASSMGVGNDLAHPKVIAAWEKVAAAARRHGKGLRLGGVKKHEDIIRTLALGARMIMTGNDMTTLVKGMRADLDAIRKSTQT